MRTRQGFTLTELLIVVIVIGILATIAIPRFALSRERAQISSIKSDLRNLAAHQELYHHSNYTYSVDLVALDFVSTEAVTITINEATSTGWAATGVHAGVLDYQCGMYSGEADPAGAVPATVPGVVTCSEM